MIVRHVRVAGPDGAPREFQSRPDGRVKKRERKARGCDLFKGSGGVHTRKVTAHL